MTTANKITVVRILMIPVFVTMAIYYGESIHHGTPLEWLRYTAIAIFVIAAVSDGLDGYVARHYNQRSSLGVILDPLADKGLLLSGIITLSISNWSDIDPDYGRFPAWFPVLVISRDAVILVGAIVLYLLNGKVQVKPNWTGIVATVLQMIAIGWVMLQLHFLPLLYVVIAAGVFTFNRDHLQNGRHFSGPIWFHLNLAIEQIKDDCAHQDDGVTRDDENGKPRREPSIIRINVAPVADA